MGYQRWLWSHHLHYGNLHFATTGAKPIWLLGRNIFGSWPLRKWGTIPFDHLGDEFSFYPEEPGCLPWSRMEVSHRDETLSYHQHKTKMICGYRYQWKRLLGVLVLVSRYSNILHRTMLFWAMKTPLQKCWQWTVLLQTWLKGGGEQQQQQTQIVCDKDIGA